MKSSIDSNEVEEGSTFEFNGQKYLKISNNRIVPLFETIEDFNRFLDSPDYRKSETEQ